MSEGNPNIASLRWQADFCRRSGSELTAAMLDASAEAIDRSCATGRRILDWPGEPIADALPLRLTGGFHAIARAEPDSALGRYYHDRSGDPLQIVAAVIASHDTFLDRWLDGPPQTNEVGRSGPLMAGLLLIGDGKPLRVELLELGSSAGLNLNLDRFGYLLGGVTAGDPASAVQLAPRWDGNPPPAGSIRVVSRRGCDMQPVDIGDPAEAERLAAYVWADQRERLTRIEAAIAIARVHPPQVERADAADWLERRLAEPQPDGVTRIVMHSVVWPYLPEPAKARVIAALEAAGARASAQRPLAWLRMEGRPIGHQLLLGSWPGGEERVLADLHPHGTWIRWLG